MDKEKMLMKQEHSLMSEQSLIMKIQVPGFFKFNISFLHFYFLYNRMNYIVWLMIITLFLTKFKLLLILKNLLLITK